MKKTTSFLIVCVAIILASCNSANHSSKSTANSGSTDLSTVPQVSDFEMLLCSYK